ncbi:MAG: endonuclease/exonuclease/phosphatase family protein, partial [Chloroflexota bacterium]
RLIRRFNRELRDDYPHQAFDPSGYGIGLLSKHPIVQQEWLRPPTNGRPILHAELNVDGQPLHVFVVHISWPTILTETSYGIPRGLHEYWQAQEIYFLQQQAEAVDGPVVILGDFNMSDQSHSYKELSAEFGDAFRDGGWGLGFTYPNYRPVLGHEIETPLLRIDYIFYDEAMQIEQADVKCFEGGSDHCALQAIFELP